MASCCHIFLLLVSISKPFCTANHFSTPCSNNIRRYTFFFYCSRSSSSLAISPPPNSPFSQATDITPERFLVFFFLFPLSSTTRVRRTQSFEFHVAHAGYRKPLRNVNLKRPSTYIRPSYPIILRHRVSAAAVGEEKTKGKKRFRRRVFIGFTIVSTGMGRGARLRFTHKTRVHGSYSPYPATLSPRRRATNTTVKDNTVVLTF